MGIRFNTNTWRAPLLLIDSWLPAEPKPPRMPRALPQAIQRFTRAGWLGRPPQPVTPSARRSGEVKLADNPNPQVAARACQLRVLRTPGATGLLRNDARLVISGRIGDVCAELDRLAAMEHRAALQQA